MDYKELIRRLDNCGEFDGGLLDDAAEAIETLLAERDALYKLVERRFWLNPEECSHYEDCYKRAYDDMRMLNCPSCENWEWRGPQKGEVDK